MTDHDILRMRPTEVTEASQRLDDLANRFEHLLQTERPNLEVGVSARDEVSQRVASTLNSVHTDFAVSADQGVAELREIAETLRSHASEINSVDEGSAL